MRFARFAAITILFISLWGSAVLFRPQSVDAQNCTTFACSGRPVHCCSGAYMCAEIITCSSSYNTNCYPANVCPDGSRSCGACPPPSSGCSPGQWGACGTQGCGALYSPQCNASGTGWNCVYNPGGCSGGGGGCVPVAPGAMNIVSPANNSTVYTNAPFLYYEDFASHGEGCPTNITYHTYLDYNCDGVGWVDYGYNHQVYNLIWGGTYCWVGQKHNGALATNTAMWRFTVAQPPTLSNYQWDANSINRCRDNSNANVAVSGRTDSTNSNNPIRFSFDVTDPNSNFGSSIDRFFNMRVAIIPDSVTTASPIIWQSIQTPGANYAHFQIDNLSAANKSFYAGNFAGSPYFGPATTTGNLAMANGKATLLNLNTATGTTVTRLGNNTYRVTMQIRLENTFNSGPVGVYVMGITQPSTGVYVSNNPDGPNAQNFRYARVASWAVDMQAPTVIVNNPIPAGSNSFTLRWQANDAAANNRGIMRIRSYCSVNGSSPFQMTDVTGGNTLLNLPTTLSNYPALSNCNITVPPLLPGAGSPLDSNRTYTYTVPATGDLQFRMYAEDGACNSSTATNSLVDPTPWILTSGGTVSARDGFRNFKIRTSSMAGILVPNISPANFFLSLYSAISGNTQMIANRISKFDYYTTNYSDLNLNPPRGVPENNWYDYLLRLLQSKFGGSLVTRNAPLTPITGSLSASATFAGVPANRQYFLINGNLTIGSNTAATLCDIKAVIFVNGNLNIIPNFNRSTGAACMFVVRGNIEILNGSKKTTIPTSSSTPATFDEIYGFFVTNGQFKTNLDDTGGGIVPDPLYINGGVVAESVSLNRSLGASHNPHQPAEAFDYDPFYIDFFKDVFADREFSLRPF